MIETIDSAKCYGCGACEKICPKSAITMTECERGFLYPVVDRKKCIECGRCIMTCQVKDTISDHSELGFKAVYAFEHSDLEVIMRSSSGGAFTALAELMLDRGGAVIGAVIDEKFSVFHRLITEKSGLDLMRKSKYVESDLRNIYLVGEEFIKSDRPLLFSGTPCQVNGFRKYLSAKGISVDKVLFCMLVCHGVPSRKVLSKYLDYSQEINHTIFTSIDFRDQTDGWKRSQFSALSQEQMKYSLIQYKLLFGLRLCNRESCFHCSYTSVYRFADISLGDFWTIEKYLGKQGSNGVSMVITHSTKGERFFYECKNKGRVEKIQFDPQKDFLQPALSYPYEKPIEYELFWKDFSRMDLKTMLNKYTGMGIKERFLRKLRRVYLTCIKD